MRRPGRLLWLLLLIPLLLIVGFGMILYPGGLVLMAAYPAESASLRDQDIPVFSLFGTRDGVGRY